MNWRRFFFENYKPKLALLFMAIFLWFFVVTSREYDQILSVPIRMINLKENKVFLIDPPAHAQVRFRGKGTSLLVLSLFGDVNLTLDLSTIKQYYDYPIRLDQVNWASGVNVQIVEILEPDTVEIRLDEEIQRNLKVKPMLLVSPAEDYTLAGSVHCSPDTVLVSGAKSIVEELKYIPTQVKNIENATGPVNVKLDLIGPEEGKVSITPSSVRLTLNVEKIETREIAEVPVNVIHCLPNKPGFADPSTVNIKIRGAKSLVESVNRDNVMISVSAQGRPAASGVFTPVVHLPDNIELVEMEPDTVRINYIEADT